MVNNKFQFPKRPISLMEQMVVMKKFFPNFQVRWRKNIITWIGEIQPHELYQQYRIKIIHQLHRVPEVSVLKPQLSTGINGEAIPHTYPGNRLCLYHPKKQEWSHQMHIAKTIVPWTALWLFYYETWQATGEWLGGGEHPVLNKRKSPSLFNSLK